MTTVVPGPLTAGPGPAVNDTAERMLATVCRLAADDFTGRRVGTPGGRAAGGWLADQLRDLGAAVTLDEFRIVGAVKDLYETPLLHWTNDLGTWRLVHRRDFCEHLASADTPQPRTGRLALPGEADLRGAWLLDGELTADRVGEAVAAGAVGLLIPRGTDEAGWMPKMIAGRAPVVLPVLAVRTDLHQQMHAFAARGIGAVTASVPLRTLDVTGANVLGVLGGGRPHRLSVLLTAHFDGVGDDPEVRLPAAADNASGVAVILEAARQLRASLAPHIGLAVALLDAEEAGAHGSAHHAPQVPAGTFVINVDGAAELGEAATVEAGGPAHPLLAALDQAGRQVGVPLRAAAMPSDNRRYAAAGLPAVGIGMGLPGYQTPAETPDRVQPETLLAAARLVVATVHHLATGIRRNTGNEKILLEATLWATDIVIASPLYWYSLSASTKTYLDYWSAWMRIPQVDFKPRMRGKALWGITALSDDDPAVAQPLAGALRHTANYLDMRWGGVLLGKGNRPGDIETDTTALTNAKTFFGGRP